jgi:rfaE bifunctional protein kinase chain/domain
VRYDVEGELAPGADDLAALADRLARWRGEARVAVLSDYGYGAVDPALVAPCRDALGGGGTLLCDSRFRLEEFGGVDGATPNEEEAERLLERTGAAAPPAIANGQGWREAGSALRERLGAAFLLVTRGSAGMVLFEPGRCAHLPVHGTDQVADVTGAGDTVIGAFALALAAGATPLEAALLADYAGGVVVMKTGTATVSPAELRAAVASDPRPREELAWAAW